MKLLLKKFSIRLILVILILLILIKSYDLIMANRFKKSKAYSLMSKYVSIYDGKIYYKEMGSGEKTVILLSGSGVSSSYTDMYNLANKVSKHSKVFIYDRFGMGKSSITKRDRDIDTLVDEFEKVLEKANQKGPYIIACHSLSSLQAISFAQKFPEKVESIVFIDGASPQFCKDFDDPMKSGVYVLSALRNSGLLRVLSNFDKIRASFQSKQDLENDIKDLEVEMILKNLWNKNMINERKSINKNGEIVLENGDLGDIKITVISAGKNGFENWENTQKHLLNLSTNSEQINLSDSGHFVHHEYLDVVADAIANEVRKE